MIHPKALRAMLALLDDPEHPHHDLMIAEVRKYGIKATANEIIDEYRIVITSKLNHD